MAVPPIVHPVRHSRKENRPLEALLYSAFPLLYHLPLELSVIPIRQGVQWPAGRLGALLYTLDLQTSTTVCSNHARYCFGEHIHLHLACSCALGE